MIAPSALPALGIQTPNPGPIAQRPRRRRRRATDPSGDVGIRQARARDAATVGELEQLDGRALPGGARLLAEVGGVPVAAIAIADDTVVADPFAPTAGIVDLLRVRARQLRISATPRLV